MLPPRLHQPLLLAICLTALGSLTNLAIPRAVAQPILPQGPIPIQQLQVLPPQREALDPVPVTVDPPAPRQAYPKPQMRAALEQPQQPGRNAGAAIEQIQSWVRELDADVFAARKAATVELIAVGQRMVEPLVREMVDRSSLEQRTRGFDILNRLATSENIDDESAAYEALRELVTSTDRALNRRATQSLASIDTIYQSRAIRKLQARGAIVSKYGQAQRIQFMPRGIVQAGEMVGPWSQVVFNEKWQGDVNDLEMLRLVPDIRHAELKGQTIDDDFLEAISHCRPLRVLRIHKTSITDKGIANLARMTELRELDVRYTRITEESLKTLATMKLTKLLLFGTRIPPTAQPKLMTTLLGAYIDIRNGGFLGVSPRDPRGLPCIINRPEPNSAAEKAGLIQDDRIIKYDGKEVEKFDDLKKFIGGNVLGDEINLTILRHGKEQEKTVVLGEWPEDRGGG